MTCAFCEYLPKNEEGYGCHEQAYLADRMQRIREDESLVRGTTTDDRNARPPSDNGATNWKLKRICPIRARSLRSFTSAPLCELTRQAAQSTFRRKRARTRVARDRDGSRRAMHHGAGLRLGKTGGGLR